MRIAVAAGFLLASWPAVAALPPKYQRLREVEAIARAATSQLRDPIDAIERLERDRYRVRAGGCAVEAGIVDAPPAARSTPWVGPRRFRVRLGEIACK